MIARFTATVMLVCLLVLGLAGTASAEQVALNANLRGENEVTGGEAGGTGSAVIRLDPDSGEICFVVRLSISEEPTAAHIHIGRAGVNGGVVFDLDWANTGGNGCITPRSTAAARQILNVPSGYYVNVHTQNHPAGAVRGQLFLPQRSGDQLAFTDSNLTLIFAIVGTTLVAGGAMLVYSARRES